MSHKMCLEPAGRSLYTQHSKSFFAVLYVMGILGMIIVYQITITRNMKINLKKKDTYIKQLEYRVSELQIENEEQRNNRNSFNQSISFLEEQIFVKD